MKPKTTNKKDRSNKILPVTLLSGFLGAGKTTLLKQILRNKHDMKVAIIVNDMGSINLDAEEVAKHKLIQEKSEIMGNLIYVSSNFMLVKLLCINHVKWHIIK